MDTIYILQDSVMLHSFTLRQQLQAARQGLQGPVFLQANWAFYNNCLSKLTFIFKTQYLDQLFHDGGWWQWTGSYMIGIPVMKELKSTFLVFKKNFLGHFNLLTTNIPIM